LEKGAVAVMSPPNLKRASPRGLGECSDDDYDVLEDGASTKALAIACFAARVGGVTALRDKVTSSAQSLVPFRSGPAKDRARQS
jgi:hypothetical protein